MSEIKLRFNMDAEEVELVVDGQVALTTGQEVFKNWVEAYNDKHAPEPEPEPAPTIEEPVEEKTVEVTAEVTEETPVEEEVVKPDEE